MRTPADNDKPVASFRHLSDLHNQTLESYDAFVSTTVGIANRLNPRTLRRNRSAFCPDCNKKSDSKRVCSNCGASFKMQ
jgi:hypothetical protein